MWTCVLLLAWRSSLWTYERRLLFAYMESSIRAYPGLSKTSYLACKTRQEHPENEVGKNVTGLENEVGTPRQLRYVPNMVRSSYGHCGDLLIVGGMTKLVPTTKNKACVRPMKGYSHNMWPCMVLGTVPLLILNFPQRLHWQEYYIYT